MFSDQKLDLGLQRDRLTFTECNVVLALGRPNLFSIESG
jgi:hypothetical protein